MRHTAVKFIPPYQFAKQREKNDRRTAALLSLGLTIAVLLYIAFTYQPLLGPDDVGIRNIVSGLYTGTPNAHSYFMRFPMTGLLAILYTLNPDGYWYALYLLVVNYSCFALIMYKIIRRVKPHSIILIWCAVIVYLFMWLRFFVTLEWTTTSGISAATAIIWYSTTYPRREDKEKLRGYIPCFILLFISWNTRNDVAKLSIPFFAIAFIWKLINKRNYKAMIPFLLVCILITGGSEFLEIQAYSSQEWKDADEFSEYRSAMYDRYGWPDYKQYKVWYEMNNITYDMYQLIKNDYNLMFPYKGVLKPENFKDLAKIAERKYYSDKNLRTRFQNALKKRWVAINGFLYRIQTVLIYAGFFVALIYAVRRKNIWKVLLVSGALIGFELIWFYLYDRNRLPSHVGYSLNIIMLALTSTFLWDISVYSIVPSESGRRVLSIAIAVCLTFCFNSWSIDRKSENDTEANDAQIFKIVKQYCQNHPNNVYYRDFYSFNNSILYKELLYVRDERAAANFIPPNGWSVVLPYDNQFLPTGGKTELCSWLQGHHNYYFLADKKYAEGKCERLVNLFASRGIKCSFKLTDELEIPNGVVIGVYHFQWW